MFDDVIGPHEYVARLTGRDRMRVRYSHRRGVLVDIVAQLECHFGGRWVPARRIDSHLELHEHTTPWDSTTDRRIPIRGVSMATALTRAIDDIKINRVQYRAACEAGLKGRSREP